MVLHEMGFGMAAADRQTRDLAFRAAGTGQKLRGKSTGISG